MELKNKLYLKAFGLAEILVALAIFSTAMIAAISVAVSSLVTVKRNELIDTANSIMISGIEYAKTPTNLTFLSANNHSLKIEGDVIDASGSSRNYEESFSVDQITTCDDTSEFKVDIIIDSQTQGFLVCHQLFLTKIDNNYQIKSIVIFNNGNELQTNELLGFRVKLSGET